MAKSSGEAKSRKKSSVTVSKDALKEVSGELRQLAEVRARFPALSKEVAGELLAHHDDEACRAKGGNTRAVDVFRGGMSWARIFGAHPTEPGVSPVRVRWFLDCLTALGVLLTGRATAGNPADESGWDDAVKRVDKLLARVERRARDAAGTNKSWHGALDAALTPDGVRDPRVSRLASLADLLERWLGVGKKAPPLGAYDLGLEQVKALREAASALDEVIASRPAPGQSDRDSPAVNAAEGRLLYVMRPLWDDLAEAREDGLTALQLTVSPALLRGLDLRSRKGGGARG